MTSGLFATLCLVAATWFSPNVRVQQEWSHHQCIHPTIAVGPVGPSRQPIYVVYERDSMAGFVPENADLMFQKSTDAGATWLVEDKLVRHIGHTNLFPDVTTDPSGNIYVVYTGRDTSAHSGHYYSVRSSDGGATWCEPVQVDDYATEVLDVQWARVASDSAGNLFCAWSDRRDKRYVWSSVSTDRGTTWRANVRVSDDSAHPRGGFSDVDVFVEPGSNQYLVAARWFYYTSLSVETGYQYEIRLYRSTDGGLTFQPSVRLDTFSYFVGDPHVVADRDHIICDYTGNPGDKDGQCLTESRTFYAEPDTWGGVVAMNDTVFSTYYYGGKLAISDDGIVHTVLMCRGADYWMGYARSVDHGASWSGVARVNDGEGVTQFPDIGVDSEGYAYAVWCDGRSNRQNEIWFSTNRPLAIAEQPTQPIGRPKAHVVTGYNGVEVEYQMPAAARVRATLHDAVGRRVGMLDAGVQNAGLHRLSWNRDQDGRRLSAGTYFVLLDMGSAQARLKAVMR